MPVFPAVLNTRLEFGRGHTVKQAPRASPDLCNFLFPTKRTKAH